MTENEILERAQIVAATLQEHRDALAYRAELLDKSAEIMAQLPLVTIGRCFVNDATLMIYGQQSHAEVMAILSALSAGKWEKKVNPSYPERLDYFTTINGVPIEIYAAEPPASCRIVEEIIDVPAHKETKRTLVCWQLEAAQ